MNTLRCGAGVGCHLNKFVEPDSSAPSTLPRFPLLIASVVAIAEDLKLAGGISLIAQGAYAFKTFLRIASKTVDLHSDFGIKRVSNVKTPTPLAEELDMRPPLGSTATPKVLTKVMRKFRKKYGNDAKCVDGLVDQANLDTKNCRECGSTNVKRKKGTPKVHCQSCKTVVNVFKNTIFERIKKPAAYLAAFWLKKHQIEVSENKFASLVGIAQSTAHEIHKKIDTVILETLMTDPVVVNSRVFVEVVCKRSIETPARQEARCEQDALDEKLREEKEKSKAKEEAKATEKDKTREAESTNDETVEFDDSVIPAEWKKKVFGAFSDQQPVHCDDLLGKTDLPIGSILATISWLETEGKVERADFGMYKRVTKIESLDKFFQIDQAKLQEFFTYIREVFHGVSRKHLQKFLARYFAHVGAIFKGTRICQ